MVNKANKLCLMSLLLFSSVTLCHKNRTCMTARYITLMRKVMTAFLTILFYSSGID